MASFHIEVTGPGRLAATGELDFATATTALESGLALIASGPAWTIDLAGVTAGDSAGLAVLVEWLSAARAGGVRVGYVSVPAQILAVARISGLEGLLVDQSG